MGFWPVTKKVLKGADVVLIVLDARMPELSRNSEIERMIKFHRKKFIYVFNKIDLIDAGGINRLRREYAQAFFVSVKENVGISKLRDFLKMLGKRKEFFVGVVGYPNVGKSALINILARRARAKTSALAGTTKGIQWISVGNLRILDSPGVIPFEDGSIKLGLLGAKEPEKQKFPEKAADELIKIFVESGKANEIKRFYNLDLGGDDSYEILLAVGRKKGFLGRGGIVDERKTAIQILRDWQRGRLRL